MTDDARRRAKEILKRLAMLKCCNVDELWEPNLDKLALDWTTQALADAIAQAVGVAVKERETELLRAYHVTLDMLGAPSNEWPCNRVNALVKQQAEENTRLRALALRLADWLGWSLTSGEASADEIARMEATVREAQALRPTEPVR